MIEKLTKDFIVITGVEISTSDGHILALDIKEDIPRNLSAEETVERILDVGGTPIVPHLLRSMSGIKEEKLKLIKNKISAIEVFNGCSVPQSNLKVAKIAKKYGLGGTGGSDSHIPEYIGSAYTIFDTTDINIANVKLLAQLSRTRGLIAIYANDDYTMPNFISYSSNNSSSFSAEALVSSSNPMYGRVDRVSIRQSASNPQRLTYTLELLIHSDPE